MQAKEIKKVLLTNQSGTFDINNDGEDDTIKVIFNSDYTKYTLKINSYEVNSNSADSNYNKDVYIYDIDKNDNYKEIAIFDNGPSDDYSIDIYHYNGYSIVFVKIYPVTLIL